MKCSQAAQALQLYIDGQLTQQEASAMEAHITRCPACHAELYLLEEIVAAAHAMPEIPEPAWLPAAIMARIAQEPRRQERAAFRSYRPSLPEAIAAATLATAVTALFIVFQTPAHTRLLPLLSDQANRVARYISPLFLTLIQPGTNLPAWMIWLLWSALGLLITLLLAGSEVRTNWRDTVRQRLPLGPR
jgi:anti-sigma factor RsiW